MIPRGTLYHFGPYRQRVEVGPHNRDFSNFRSVFGAEVWAHRRGLRFVDHSHRDFRRVSNPQRAEGHRPGGAPAPTADGPYLVTY